MTEYASDHAFTAFLAGCGDRFVGIEKTMQRYFKSHPGAKEYAAVEAALAAYSRGKRK
jgi:hypothetical protein